MDAKFFSTKSIDLSGIKLLWVLTSSLSLAAIALDAIAGRPFLGLTSLGLPLLVAAILSAALGLWVVPLLRSLKAGQFIRAEGPQAHLKKAGTPTMGGIFFIPVAAVVAVGLTGFSGHVLAVTALMLAYGLIGWLDDWQVLRRRSNKGISPRMKLALQIGFAVLFCLWTLGTQPAAITTVSLPFGWFLPLGFLFWPLAGFALVAESNATNLTDGVDGLMAGTGAIALLGFGALVAPSHPDLMVFCAALSGACLGFLAHNRNPAKVFMGDTGSLALGGALAAVGILSGNLFGLLVVTLLFFAETVSVILQVGYYKATKGPDGIGKRLFRMAPLHHHFELSGWSEVRVVATFYGVTAFLALMALATLS
ncbi:MAG: phospho-N-acetylmuramoyl-pentapeptide-transferase [Leptolyngbya sp. SIO4C5]|uniref:phospho-N-acetylmuramoyl-pentapeptide- transferase n=1 Tax=Sphaerothrix gracilis TaxID=3151835 RepID=UPI0013BFDADC|nr:phospho-N-acetylmuramoyl-pentapeptide-transferase [Leptolyngbya sp. SIO4C5]